MSLTIPPHPNPRIESGAGSLQTHPDPPFGWVPRWVPRERETEYFSITPYLLPPIL